MMHISESPLSFTWRKRLNCGLANKYASFSVALVNRTHKSRAVHMRAWANSGPKPHLARQHITAERNGRHIADDVFKCIF